MERVRSWTDEWWCLCPRKLDVWLLSRGVTRKHVSATVQNKLVRCFVLPEGIANAYDVEKYSCCLPEMPHQEIEGS